MNSIDEYKLYKNFNIDKIVSLANDIKRIRKLVDTQSIRFESVLNYYSSFTKKLISFISEFSLLNHNNEISKMIIAYVNLLKAKENSGIERAILSNVFSTGKMNAKLYREFSVLFTAHQTYITSYKSLIGKKQLQNFNKQMLDESIEEVEELRELAFSKVMKDKIISDIKALAGYGGLIHNFKNFILRGDLKYHDKVIKNYKAIQSSIIEFKSLSTITNKEIELVDIISNTFDKYRLVLQLAATVQEQSTAISLVDKMVKIDDNPAVEAIDTLSNNILGANATYWYNVSTKRINILKSIEDNFVNYMVSSTDSIKLKLSDKLILNLIIFTSIFFILFIMSISLIYQTSASLKGVQEGLINFFNYLTSDSKDVEEINIINNDELGQMGQMINKNIKKSKVYLDEKIAQQLAENKKKDEMLFQQSKMVAMGEMIGNIAHQWRQPLSVISTGATGMQMQKEYGVLSDDQFNKTCEDINTNAQYLSKTIDDFRNFIKGDRKKTIFKLKEEMKVFLQLVESSIKTYHIDVILDIEENISVNGYKNELTQCLINIFNNAKDILLEIENQKDRLVFISTEINNDNDVVIKIRDSAGGIPEDILPKIFEPYFTTKHQAQGTGLGLHMTYNLIVDGMSGMVEAKNVNYVYNDQDFIGAEFAITIPFK